MRFINNTLNGVDISHQLDRASGGLAKPYQRGKVHLDKVITECNLPPRLEQIIRHEAGRDMLHLMRMLRRSPAERTFGLAYLKYYELLFPRLPETRHIQYVLNDEGHDTKMFWTFAPYLYKVFIEKNIHPFKALKTILRWTLGGTSCALECDKPKEQRLNSEKMHMLGLEKYGDGGDNDSWVLNPDPNHVSHAYTEQEARIIAELLLVDQQPTTRGNP